ncbi:Membrane-associated phospholipid phosphatase [Fructilactobacillus florum 8D]|uniref:Membrane-associated phospholipid phosphatase n=1 Tax=Fructilactobacillus florum 8D TaxID=1221538 RepID=W9EMD6_9LACO|nr:phosphatase PAP2 family protein [Fructilactobacillus florum]EKK20560.1 Membrane-associated phospholipid phosphatase [Fructilactobacillus florum 2F]ETO40834.1 Membrane-associated phospholipid phosphatase [Fructilactobacillus florum 8D]
MIIKQDPSRPYKLVIAAIIFGVVLIGVQMQTGFLNFFDTLLIMVVQKLKFGSADTLYTLVSFMASPKLDVIWMLLIAFFLWGSRYKIPAIFSLALLVGANALAFVVKTIVARPRPMLHLKQDTGYSFPSGHVIGTLMVVSVLWILVIPRLKRETNRWLLRSLLGIWLVLVMLSRVYLNAHFPTDVIGAFALGYAWLQISEYLYRWLAPQLSHWHIFQNSSY